MRETLSKAGGGGLLYGGRCPCGGLKFSDGPVHIVTLMARIALW
jgi:hypothetical protein